CSSDLGPSHRIWRSSVRATWPGWLGNIVPSAVPMRSAAGLFGSTRSVTWVVKATSDRCNTPGTEESAKVAAREAKGDPPWSSAIATVSFLVVEDRFGDLDGHELVTDVAVDRLPDAFAAAL